jgi:uncharacterized membrane protein
MNEKKRRSIIKALTYRFLATIATFLIAYLFTSDLDLATRIGLFDSAIKFVLIYLNERVWLKSDWGRKKSDSLNLNSSK